MATSIDPVNPVKLFLFFLLLIPAISSAQNIKPIVDFTESDIRSFDLTSGFPFDSTEFDRSFPAKIATELDERLKEAVKKSKVTGVSVTIMRPGCGVWHGVGGLADVENKTPVVRETRFHAGSIGKIYTAVLLFELIESGRLKLEDTIDRWFPDFPNANAITVDHLMSHTSGIYSFNWLAKFRDTDEYFAPGDIIAAVKAEKPHFPPGQKWSYNNTGFVMLAGIIAQENGRSFEDMLRERIIDRLNLNNTIVITDENQTVTVCRGYHQGKYIKEYVNYAGPYGAGIIAANSADVVYFFYALVTERLISRSWLQTMTERMYPMGTGITWFGRGMILMQSPLGPMLYFAGRIAGFGAMVGYLVDQQTFISVLLNDETPADPFWYALLNDLQWDVN